MIMEPENQMQGQCTRGLSLSNMYYIDGGWGQEYLTDVNRGDKEHIRKDCNSYFDSCYRSLEDRTKKKLDYFKPYVFGQINIRTVSSSTVHNNDKEYYRNILLYSS